MESRVFFLLLVKMLVVMSVTGCARFRATQDAEPEEPFGQAPVIEPELERREMVAFEIADEVRCAQDEGPVKQLHNLTLRGARASLPGTPAIG